MVSGYDVWWWSLLRCERGPLPEVRAEVRLLSIAPSYTVTEMPLLMVRLKRHTQGIVVIVYNRVICIFLGRKLMIRCDIICTVVSVADVDRRLICLLDPARCHGLLRCIYVPVW